MLPVIAIVGRPNVGKSTLFNCITRSSDALVADIPGVTRDRQYGKAEWNNRSFIVVDTGGIYENTGDNFYPSVLAQSRQAITEADAIIFVVDARASLTSADREIARELHKTAKPVSIAINKIDGQDPELTKAEFYASGFKNFIPISAAHRQGLDHLLQAILDSLPSEIAEEHLPDGIKIAIAGRPNVGKSTLVNRILGEERVIVCDQAGTTRDSIYIPFSRFEKNYILIDTAGVRRRGRIDNPVEKFSVIKTLQAIEDSHVVIFLVDAQEGIVDQDLHLLSFILQSGKGLIMAINKWDGLEENQKQRVKTELERRLPFIKYIRQLFISALHGTNVGHLFKSIDEAYQSASKDISTNEVTEVLRRAFEAHQPPAAQGRPIKLRYGHLGGHFPPLFIIHGNRTEHLPESYRRYLINTFHDAFDLYGTAIRVEFRSGDNPFKHQKNELTDRQRKKKQRLIKNSGPR